MTAPGTPPSPVPLAQPFGPEVTESLALRETQPAQAESAQKASVAGDWAHFIARILGPAAAQS